MSDNKTTIASAKIPRGWKAAGDTMAERQDDRIQNGFKPRGRPPREGSEAWQRRQQQNQAAEQRKSRGESTAAASTTTTPLLGASAPQRAPRPKQSFSPASTEKKPPQKRSFETLIRQDNTVAVHPRRCPPPRVAEQLGIVHAPVPAPEWVPPRGCNFDPVWARAALSEDEKKLPEETQIALLEIRWDCQWEAGHTFCLFPWPRL